MNKTKKTRTRLAPEARENEILSLAAKIVSQEGVFALSIERIGKTLDISKSTVYSYFPSLTDLLQVLLKREMKSLRAQQQKAVMEANNLQQLVRDVTHTYLSYIEKKGLLISRLQAEPSVASIGGPTDFGRETAVNYLAETISITFDIPMAIAVPAVDISFGIPEAAGHCLIRGITDKQTIEDLTVAMILACVETTKNGYNLSLRPIQKPKLV